MKSRTLRICKSILYPHKAFLLIFFPISFAFLIYSLLFIGTDSLISYISYALSFYSLLTVSLRAPSIVGYIKTLQSENALFIRIRSDARLRISISLYGALALNTAYAIFQLGLGFYHTSVWYYAMSAYYVLLALIRFFLLKHTRNYGPTVKPRGELFRYGACGAVLLIMNVTLSVIIFFMVYHERSFRHHEITTIALAAYTFTAFTTSIISIIKYRKYKSPVFSASKITSLTAASVSMLTLEATMLSTFGTAGDENFRRIMLTLSGAAIFVFITVMAIYMITTAFRALKNNDIKQAGEIQ